MDFERVLKRVGLPVLVDRVSNEDGYFDPVGIVWHHTAGTNSLSIVKHGRPGIPGPLCNLLLRKDGSFIVIANGKGNDTGMGSGRVLEEVRDGAAVRKNAYDRGLQDTVSGNAYFYDIEVENLGNGRDEYPRKQLRALVLGTAAILEQRGWSARRVVHHREWSRRKIDMSYQKELRDDVQRTVNVLKLPVLEEGMGRPKKTAKLHRLLVERGVGTKAELYTKLGRPRRKWQPTTTKAIKEFQRKRGLKVDGIAGKQTWLHLHNLHFPKG